MAVGCWLILPHGVAVSKARLRSLPLRQRKAKLTRIGKEAEDWIALTNGIVGEGRALFRAAVEADLEGIVAKRLIDAYHSKFARWHKVLNRGYSLRVRTRLRSLVVSSSKRA